MKTEVIELDDFLNEVRDADPDKVYYFVSHVPSKTNTEGVMGFKSIMHLSTVYEESKFNSAPLSSIRANIVLVEGTMSNKKEADELDKETEKEKEGVIKQIKQYMSSRGIQVIHGARSI